MTMTQRTPLEVISEQRVHGVQVAYRAEYFIKALADAGFAIVPKEPTAKMIEEGSCVDGKHSALEIWRYMVEAALGETPQPAPLENGETK
jgi:hypothetical protein